jgi:hypothetical protein
MDGLTFTVDLVKTLAWPTVGLAAIVLLRSQISELLRSVSGIKIPGYLEIDMDKALRATEALAEKALPWPTTDQSQARRLFGTGTIEIGNLLDIARKNPTAAVILAWTDVERALLETAKRNNMVRDEEPATQNPVYVARALTLKRKMDDITYAIFAELNRIRNSTVHAGGPEISSEQALLFGDLASRFVQKLERI